MTRTEELLRAASEILSKCKDSHTVLSPMEVTAFYDEADCDGYCLLEDIKTHLDMEEAKANENNKRLKRGFVIERLKNGEVLSEERTRKAHLIYRHTHAPWRVFVIKSHFGRSGVFMMKTKLDAMIEEYRKQERGEE